MESDDEVTVPRGGITRKRRSERSVMSDDESAQTKTNKKKKSKGTSSKNKGSSKASGSQSNKKLKPTCNIVNYVKQKEMNFRYLKYRSPLKDIIIKYCKSFKIHKIESPFDRRVTFLIWHPTNPRLLAVASHWGDVILYDHEKDVASASLIQGIGPGGSIQGMRFDPLNPNQIYAASMEGKFMIMNFETKTSKSFLQTNDINRWYISVDVNLVNNTLVAGDTKGGVSILTVQGEVILDRLQLHKKISKVSHAEFSQREPWLLCTSSTDCTMKLWDIRSLRSDTSGMVKPLQTVEHEKPINAAYFSLKDGSKLLTTDQSNKIFIYRAPLWDLETCIMHPHRQFQHLTPIKAYWHPLEDIVLVGRYPHNDFPDYYSGELRTIDFFDADTGEMLHQHHQIGCNGILSLNRFNITGDVLASSYGAHFLIWKPKLKTLNESNDKECLNKKETHKGSDTDSDEKDWNALLKKQAKEKQTMKKKLKTKFEVRVTNEKNDDES